MPDKTDDKLTQPLVALREQTLQRLRNGLRRGQQSMTDWQEGQLAVSAVPGAGKSTGMAVAAAFAITTGLYEPY